MNAQLNQGFAGASVRIASHEEYVTRQRMHGPG